MPVEAHTSNLSSIADSLHSDKGGNGDSKVTDKVNDKLDEQNSGTLVPKLEQKDFVEQPVIVHTSDKQSYPVENSYPLENFQENNFFYPQTINPINSINSINLLGHQHNQISQHHLQNIQQHNQQFYGEPDGGYNWPHDLSRNSTKPKLSEHINAFEHINYAIHAQNDHYMRGQYGFPPTSMKGNLAFSQYLTTSSSHQLHPHLFDANNNRLVHFTHDIDDVIAETLKDEPNCSTVENDSVAHNYITLTTTANDLHSLKDYSHQHNSTSSGDSRSPNGYSHEDFDSNNLNFTQLTNLSNRNAAMMYPASPNDHQNNGYDSLAQLTPVR